MQKKIKQNKVCAYMLLTFCSFACFFIQRIFGIGECIQWTLQQELTG